MRATYGLIVRDAVVAAVWRGAWTVMNSGQAGGLIAAQAWSRMLNQCTREI
jgi:hypothetical protein